MSPDGLEKFQTELVGRGSRPAFQGATKKFRATGQNVPIKIITSGEYPGDGKPKSIRFYESSEHFVVIDGVKTVALPKLIELKLASGISGLARLKDLADVQELIRVRGLMKAWPSNSTPPCVPNTSNSTARLHKPARKTSRRRSATVRHDGRIFYRCLSKRERGPEMVPAFYVDSPSGSRTRLLAVKVPHPNR